MNKLLVFHGIRTNGDDNIDLLGGRIAAAGFPVVFVDMKNTRITSSRSKRILNENMDRIGRIYREGDHVLAHSNGVRTSHFLQNNGFKFGKCMFFNGALDSRVEFPEGSYEEILNVYNRRDSALMFGAMRPRHDWGALGRIGYRGKSPRVQNYEDKTRKFFSLNHANFAHPDYIECWKDICLAFLDYEPDNSLQR